MTLELLKSIVHAYEAEQKSIEALADSVQKTGNKPVPILEEICNTKCREMTKVLKQCKDYIAEQEKPRVLN